MHHLRYVCLILLFIASVDLNAKNGETGVLISLRNNIDIYYNRQTEIVSICMRTERSDQDAPRLGLDLGFGSIHFIEIKDQIDELYCRTFEFQSSWSPSQNPEDQGEFAETEPLCPDTDNEDLASSKSILSE